MKNNKAFTLIELLVVVLIIGILAAIAVPQYQKAVLKSRLSNLKILTSSIAEAEEINYLKTGQYTINPEELDIVLPSAVEVDKTNAATSVIFDWGVCRFSSFQIKCKNIKAGTQFSVYYSNGGHTYSGRQDCCAKTDNSTAVSICQNETGSNQTIWVGTDHDAKYSISCYLYNK